MPEATQLISTESPDNYEPVANYPGEKEISEIRKEIERVDGLILSINKERNESYMKATETIAIFVSLFTFISVEFQIFKSNELSLYSGIAFTLILLGGLVLFVFMFEIVIKKEFKNVFLLILPLLLILIGLFSFKVGEDIKNNSNKIILDEVVSSSTQHFFDYRNCLLSNITPYQCAKLQKTH